MTAMQWVGVVMLGIAYLGMWMYVANDVLEGLVVGLGFAFAIGFALVAIMLVGGVLP